MDLVKSLRTLAKQDYYQSLFTCSKEMGGMQLFENITAPTRHQLCFISFLSLYQTINMDIALHEVDERVLDNDIYEDAYMYWKRTKQLDKKAVSGPKAPEVAPTSRWVFRKPKKD